MKLFSIYTTNINLIVRVGTINLYISRALNRTISWSDVQLISSERHHARSVNQVQIRFSKLVFLYIIYFYNLQLL